MQRRRQIFLVVRRVGVGVGVGVTVVLSFSFLLALVLRRLYRVPFNQLRCQPQFSSYL